MARTLNEIMEESYVIRIMEDGTISEDTPGVYAPELSVDTDRNGQILKVHEDAFLAAAKREGWDILTGWSGQYNYSGPFFGDGEYIGGKLEDHIRETPGYWVYVACRTDRPCCAGNDECDGPDEPCTVCEVGGHYDSPDEGWYLAHRDAA